jgi:hypothetical protein
VTLISLCKNKLVFTELTDSACLLPLCPQRIPLPISPRSILMLSTHQRIGLPSGHFPSGFPTSNLYIHTHTHLFFPFVLHAVPMSSSLTYSWRRVQVMELFIMQPPPISCHFIAPWFKYFPRYPVKLKGVLLKIEDMWMNTKFCLNLLSEIQNNLKLCVILRKQKLCAADTCSCI